LTIDNDRIAASKLGSAILGLETTLGRAFAEDILIALEDAGIDLSQSKKYSLNQIKKELVGIFGEDATELLMPRIRKNLIGIDPPEHS
jgi:hypothetical protein